MILVRYQLFSLGKNKSDNKKLLTEAYQQLPQISKMRNFAKNS